MVAQLSARGGGGGSAVERGAAGRELARVGVGHARGEVVGDGGGVPVLVVVRWKRLAIGSVESIRCFFLEVLNRKQLQCLACGKKICRMREREREREWNSMKMLREIGCLALGEDLS